MKDYACNMLSSSFFTGAAFTRRAMMLALTALVLLVPAAAHAQDVQPLPDERPLYVPGSLVVGISPDAATFAADPAAAVQAASALEGLDVQVVQATDPCVAGDAASAAGVQADGTAVGPVVQTWQVPPGEEDAAIALLSQQPGIAFVERDVYVYAAQEGTVTPTGDNAAADKQAAETVYQVNDPLYAPYQWGPQRANFPRAWQLVPVSPTLTSVRVGVIDSGVDFTHPDLGLRLLPGKNYINPNILPIDDYGHGTHVTGIIAAFTNNSVGIVGSAPKVLIDPRKVLDNLGAGQGTNVRYAICDAARAGDRIINLSLEVSPESMPVGSTLYNLLKGAMDFAEARGVLIVAAGGNHGAVWYPALFDEVMAVSALTIDDTLAYYSAQGPKIEIAAPGGDGTNPIYSTWPTGSTQTEQNQLQKNCGTGRLVKSGSASYCGIAGTSMASPLVAGGAALAWSLNPALTAAEVRSLLKETAADVGLPATSQGAGLLNAEGIVRRLLPSALVAAPIGFGRTVAAGTAPYTTTIVLSNPSLDPLAVTAVTVGGGSWLTITNSTSPTVTGSIRYGQPLALSAVISPTYLAAGTYSAKVQLSGVRTDGTSVADSLTIFVAVGAAHPSLYLPVMLQQSQLKQPVITTLDFTWETPISPTAYTLGASDSVTVPLPFAFPFAGPTGTESLTYDSARIYADGFVTFPAGSAATVPNPGTNRCLPVVDVDAVQGVFGWWADLDAGVPGATISTFRPAGTPNRFVIEYENVASAGADPAYRVSFQIVLYASGDVQFNYLQVPSPWAPSLTDLRPLATVGVQAQNGLFRNQVACQTAAVRQGILPLPNQSLRISNADLY